MDKQTEIDPVKRKQGIIITAIFLGIIALIVAVMPFFYLKDMVVPG